MVFKASSSNITISVELRMINELSIMVEKQIRIVDIPANGAFA
jgi:hypothetical protein